MHRFSHKHTICPLSILPDGFKSYRILPEQKARCGPWVFGWGDAKRKTYNSGDSLVVTHLTTNPPVHCLYMAERTGSLVFSVLWSYVVGLDAYIQYIAEMMNS